MEAFQQSLQSMEALTGLRAPWNVWPNGKIDAHRRGVPVSLLYTPTKDIANMAYLDYEPVTCKRCGAVLCPQMFLDYTNKLFTCCLCSARNHLPQSYQGISDVNLPSECIRTNSTVEYNITPRDQREGLAPHPSFVFMIDTTVAEDEFQSQKDALYRVLAQLPPSASVALISYGMTVTVHELAFEHFPRSYVFRGEKDLEPARLAQLLGLRRGCAQRILMPYGECEFTLQQIIDDIQRDAWPVEGRQRPHRFTGAAISVAQGVAAALVPNQPARVMLFAGGACTSGPGQIVDRSHAIPVRSSSDIYERQKAAEHVASASKYYASVAERFVTAGHCIDIVMGSLEQVGLHEMRPLVDLCGGEYIMAETFSDEQLQESVVRIIDACVIGCADLPGEPGNNAYKVGTNGTLTLDTSPDIKIGGCLGACAPMKPSHRGQPSAGFGELKIGKYGTNEWKLPALSNRTTICVFLEPDTPQPAAGEGPVEGKRYVQFRLQYTHADGSRRLRVTTMAYALVDKTDTAKIASGFDQEAAAAVTARMAVARADTGLDSKAVRKQVDHSIIKVCAAFSEYTRGQPDSFRSLPNFEFFPQFLYHFRRSPLVDTAAQSPDESAFFRHNLLVEPVFTSMAMIQPILLSYSMTDGPKPVLLDSTSAEQGAILVCDTFFKVIVWHGSHIAGWRDAGYHKQEQYARLAEILDSSLSAAMDIRATRFPVPQIVQCDQGSGGARWLLSRLNPTTRFKDDQSGSQKLGETILTDDLPLQQFLKRLRHVVVDA